MMHSNIPGFLVVLQEILYSQEPIMGSWYSKFLKITFSCNFLFPFLSLDT